MKAPESLESARLLYRRPSRRDAEEVFSRYASDAAVTRYVGFLRHRSLRDTSEFLTWSDEEWRRWPAGPYLIRRREDSVLVGSTGLSFEAPYRAMTGYVFAGDSWGKGYATEALRMMTQIAGSTGVRRLYALCHTAHEASRHVLEKCSFTLEGTLRRYMIFPNLDAGEPADVFIYALIL